MESDLYGIQTRVWKMIRRQRTNKNEFLLVDGVAKEQHLSSLHAVDEHKKISQEATR